MMEEIELIRIRDNGVLTMGRWNIYDSLDSATQTEPVFDCVTLEPSWILNQSFISCIPTGRYKIRTIEDHETFGKCLLLHDVPGRTGILVHLMNYFKQTEGCIGVGRRFKYLDEDNKVDVTLSKVTMDEIFDVLGHPWEGFINIKNHGQFQKMYV